MLHPCNYSKPAAADNFGKFTKVAVAGLHRFDNHGYRLHRYEISSRKVGMTVKRTLYSVTILGEAGERLTFLTDLPTTERLARRRKPGSTASWLGGPNPSAAAHSHIGRKVPL